MKLGETITVELGGQRLTLRPSLRCALRLERRPGSFADLLTHLMEGSLNASADVLRDHVYYNESLLLTRIMDTGLDTLKPSLIEFVIACSGIATDLHNDAPKGEPVPFREHLLSLYKLATGWLGWSPDVALSATPQEIILAYKGRCEMLKAIFGSSEQPKGDWGARLKAALIAKSTPEGPAS